MQNAFNKNTIENMMVNLNDFLKENLERHKYATASVCSVGHDVNVTVGIGGCGDESDVDVKFNISPADYSNPNLWNVVVNGNTTVRDFMIAMNMGSEADKYQPDCEKNVIGFDGVIAIIHEHVMHAALEYAFAK